MVGVGHSRSGSMTKAHIMTEIVTTPPIPSSSPAPGNDSMEISPLPHKAPYAVASRVEARSPSPEKTTANTLLASPVITSQVEVEVPIQTVPLE